MYDKQKIADDLLKLAKGISYNGNSLRVAKDFNCITQEERHLLDKFAVISRKCTTEDKLHLQNIAIKIKSNHHNFSYCQQLDLELPSKTKNFESVNSNFTSSGITKTYKCNIDNKLYKVTIECME